MLATAYLFTYNLVQLLGWTYLGWLAAAHLAAGGGLASLYPATAAQLQIWQTLALLEIAHAGLGLVRSSVQARAGNEPSRSLKLYNHGEGPTSAYSWLKESTKRRH